MDDYCGVGPGAHGRRQGLATQRHRKPENWLAAMGRNGHGLVEETPLSPRERAVEALLMGLRLTEGVDLDRISDRSGLAADQLVDRRAAERLARQGLVASEGSRLRVTDAGMLLLDAILAEIVAA
jgi:oxygen-independent coproporphyrinogen-3 oxidase